MTAPAAVHRPWHCYQHAIRCQHGHLFRIKSTGFHEGKASKLYGHRLLECLECEPHTFFFLHLVAQPDAMVTCYAISKESFREWENADTPDTPELLFRLRDPNGHSYNPNWRAAT